MLAATVSVDSNRLSEIPMHKSASYRIASAGSRDSKKNNHAPTLRPRVILLEFPRYKHTDYNRTDYSGMLRIREIVTLNEVYTRLLLKQ